ncbi:MAG: MATE family efflux transporter [Clostridiales bacterium]|nr:MATE family efflux transporter [Clostridiales bacterium]
MKNVSVRWKMIILALITLIVNLFMGLSVGASVTTAYCYGAKDSEGVHQVVHTSILSAAIAGILVGIIGFFVSTPALRLMEAPDNVIGQSATYMKIYFCGTPAMMVYNFGASIVRSSGDTKRPLYYLSISGVVNIILNLIFVIVFHLDVAGVAIATVISQFISAACILVHMLRCDKWYKLEIRKLRIYPEKLLKIIRIGVPAGLQSSVFSISNVVVQSSINSFGSIAVNGNAAAASLEGFMYLSVNAFHQSAVSFTGQNIGAKKYHRTGSIMKAALALAAAVSIVMGGVFLLFREELLHIYIPAYMPNSQAAVAYGVQRLIIICSTYYLCSGNDVMTGVLRGMGTSLVPALISVIGVCGTRILWVLLIFPSFHTITSLYISYPVSWFISFAAQIICFIFVKRRLQKQMENIERKQKTPPAEETA